MKCAIYTRYSSELQKETSPDDQIRNCREFASRRGWQVLDKHIYVDRKVSGASLHNRLQLIRMLDVSSTKPRPFDYILVDDTSRLSRNKADQINIIADLRDAGIYVYFVSQQIDTADEQAEDVILPIHGIVDSLYLKELAKKTQRGMAGRVLDGYNAGGRLYGYKYYPVPDPSGAIDKKTRNVKLIGTRIGIDEESVPIVLRVFRMYDAGCGYKEIAKFLNSEGVVPPGAAVQRRKSPNLSPSWCPTQLRSMLRNSKYVGDWTWNKFRWVKNRHTGKRMYRERSKDDWVTSSRPDLQIIPIDLWQSVQARVRKNQTIPQRGKKPGTKHLFTGMLRCGVCGSNLIIAYGNQKDPVFTCSKNWHRGESVCSNSFKVRKSEVEGKILESLREQLLRPDTLKRIAERLNEKLSYHNTSLGDQRENIALTKARLEYEIDNLIEYLANNGDPTGRIKAKLSIKENELAETTRQMNTFSESGLTEKIHVDPHQASFEYFRTSKALLEDIPLARLMLKRLVDDFVLSPVVENGSKFLDSKGKIKLPGLLGDNQNSTTLQNSGGRI